MTEAKKTEQAKADKPIVLEKDYAYSKGLKNLQKSEKSYSEALQTLADAVKQGVDSYLEERDKSALEKKDGALEDLFINSAKGASVAVEAGSSAIYDVAKSIDSYWLTDSQRKNVKRSIRGFSRFGVPSPFSFFGGSDDDDDDDD